MWAHWTRPGRHGHTPLPWTLVPQDRHPSGSIIYPVIQLKNFRATIISLSFSLPSLTRSSHSIFSIIAASHHFSRFIWSMLSSSVSKLIQQLRWYLCFPFLLLSNPFLPCSPHDHVHMETGPWQVHPDKPSPTCLWAQNRKGTADCGLQAVPELALPSSPNTSPVCLHLLSLPLGCALCLLSLPRGLALALRVAWNSPSSAGMFSCSGLCPKPSSSEGPPDPQSIRAALLLPVPSLLTLPWHKLRPWLCHVLGVHSLCDGPRRMYGP